MKTILSLTYQGIVLTVLAEIKEENKAYISYFLNDIEVWDWHKIKPIYQGLFTCLADEICSVNKAVKWSY